MSTHHVARTARELGLGVAQVQATADLLGEGATVPFLARYRKEATGSLDEVAITAIRDRLAQLGALDARRTAIVASLEERNLLTDDLRHNWTPPRRWRRWRTSTNRSVPSGARGHPSRATRASSHWPMCCFVRTHASIRWPRLDAL